MPGYIELDKQASFPSSSNVGKVILGVTSNGNVTTTNNEGVTTIVNGGLPYAEYVSKISSLALTSPKTNTVLNNTLGINPIWERFGSGRYRFNLNKQIDINKSFSNAPISNESFIYSSIINEINSSNGFGNGFDNEVYSIVVQPDGKILVGGDFGAYNGNTVRRIIRLNPDGSVDNTFHSNDGFNGSVKSIVIQSDGKILVGGNFTSYNESYSNRIIRLNPDGSQDGSFSIGDGFNGSVLCITIQPNGKILVGGDFEGYNGDGYNKIIRLNPDGSVDNSFIHGSWFNSTVYSIVIQPDWKIIVGGDFTYYNEVNYNCIIRLNYDATIDTSFVIGGGFNSTVYSIVIQSDGKIVVGGHFTYYNGISYNNIIRLNPDGSQDGSFSIGDGFNNKVNSIVIQSDGKILVGGGFTTYNGISYNNIIRLNSDGSQDNTFSIGNGFNSKVYTIVIQSDGKILVGGVFDSYNGTSSNRIIRLNPDGSIGFADGFDGPVTYILTQLDGNILVGGDFTTYNSISSNRIIRLTSNGGIDYTFSGVTDGFNGGIRSIITQSNGKILVGGHFTTYNGTNCNRIIKLNSDGSIDETFSIGEGFNDSVYTIVIQSDGKIIVGGDFTTYNGTSLNRIIRLNPDGSQDGSFSIGDGFNGSVLCITIQPNGKILVGGDFEGYNGDGYNKIIRLNPDGSVDNSFIHGSWFNSTVYSIVIQPDWKIIVGGDFTYYNEVNYNCIIRLNYDATIDTSFVIGGGFNSTVYSIVIQSDGKIVVGGHFTYYNGTSSNGIIRLNTDGTVDNTFGNGVNDTIKSIIVQPDGKILIGGYFTAYDTYGGLNYIVRINSDGTLDNDFTNTGEVLNSTVNTLGLLSNGNILVGGTFTSGNRYSNYIRNYTNDYYYYLYNAVDTLINQEIEMRLYN